MAGSRCFVVLVTSFLNLVIAISPSIDRTYTQSEACLSSIKPCYNQTTLDLFCISTHQHDHSHNRSFNLQRFRDGNTSWYVLLVLLTSGDINLNPGPKFPCGCCEKPVRWNQKGICCDHCDKWYHKSCANVSSASYSVLNNSSASWICYECGLPNFDSFFFQSQELDVSNRFTVYTA